MITEPVILVFDVAVGMILGMSFFGGLWWTVLRGLTSPTPALWFLGSLLLRTGIAVTGFLWVSHGHWDRLLACLLGFFAARIIVTHLTRDRTKGSDYAPESR